MTINLPFSKLQKKGEEEFQKKKRPKITIPNSDFTVVLFGWDLKNQGNYGERQAFLDSE